MTALMQCLASCTAAVAPIAALPRASFITAAARENRPACGLTVGHERQGLVTDEVARGCSRESHTGFVPQNLCTCF